MKKIILLLLITSAAQADETVYCRGSYWAYKFAIKDNVCFQENKVIKDIPGVYKKNHISKFDKTLPIECWESISKIQMDSAVCCLEIGDSHPEDISCRTKKIIY